MSLSPEARASLAKFKKGLIDRLPKEITKAAAGALEISGKEIADMARRLAPVDEGDLRKSIGHEVNQAELKVTVFAGGKTAWWARWVEFGTRKMSARPFFFSAYRALKKRARSRIARALGKAVRAVGGNSQSS